MIEYEVKAWAYVEVRTTIRAKNRRHMRQVAIGYGATAEWIRDGEPFGDPKYLEILSEKPVQEGNPSDV